MSNTGECYVFVSVNFLPSWYFISLKFSLLFLKLNYRIIDSLAARAHCQLGNLAVC